MKYSSKKLLAMTLAACCLGTAASAQADSKLQNLNIINVTCRLQLQGGFTDNGSQRHYANPIIARFGTKELLAVLAADKYAQANYAANYFPRGSKLAVTQEGTFVVVSRNNDFLADVSDLMHFGTGTNDILSGRVDSNTGLASPNRSNLMLVTLHFDDTSITNGSNLSFSIQGLDQLKTRDTKPGNSGNYNENTTDQIKNAIGEGQSQGTPFIITGSIHGNSKSKLTLLPPT